MAPASSGSLVTVAANHLHSTGMPSSSSSSSPSSSSTESAWTPNCQSYSSNPAGSTNCNTFFIKEELKGYTLPCSQSQHVGGSVERYSRHSSSRAAPYSTGGYHYSSHLSTQNHNQLPVINYCQQELEPSTGLIATSPNQFSTPNSSGNNSFCLL